MVFGNVMHLCTTIKTQFASKYNVNDIVIPYLPITGKTTRVYTIWQTKKNPLGRKTTRDINLSLFNMTQFSYPTATYIFCIPMNTHNDNAFTTQR